MIESVPPEILEQVFKHLDPVSRKSVRLVNRKWADILWTDVYLRSQALIVNPATLTDDWVLQQMKRPFHEIHITTDDVIPVENWKTIYYERVKDLITSAVVVENVRVIKLDANLVVLNYLFRNKHVVSYKKLEEFTFLTSTSAGNPVSERVNINVRFPNLKVLKLDYLSSGNLRLIRIFSRQLIKLVVRVGYIQRLLAILAITSFDNLTELAIGTVPHSHSGFEILAPDDINAQHLAVLRRLHRLEINDASNMFVFVYHVLFEEMRNLRHLKVTGTDMLPNVWEAVNQLENLQFLQILARSRNQTHIHRIRINLPNLETLHLAPQSMACAGQLPKLRTLGVIIHSKEGARWGRFSGPAALQTFTRLRTLQKLHVRGIFFSNQNLYPFMHFRRSCKMLLEDKEDYLIGTINVPRSVDIASLRCNYRDEIDGLTIKRPAVAPSAGLENQDVSLYGALQSRSCTAWIVRQLMRQMATLVCDYKAFRRAMQRDNLYTLKKHGCTCYRCNRFLLRDV
ncbi:hypothetical protein RP20_CCG015787 [Aedes albopictus]|nr:hypothetical protein RP20_CCG015787 [Aedes albopictus]